VAISYNTAPNEKRSVRASVAFLWLAPATCMPLSQAPCPGLSVARHSSQPSLEPYTGRLRDLLLIASVWRARNPKSWRALFWSQRYCGLDVAMNDTFAVRGIERIAISMASKSNFSLSSGLR